MALRLLAEHSNVKLVSDAAQKQPQIIVETKPSKNYFNLKCIVLRAIHPSFRALTLTYSVFSNGRTPETIFSAS